MALSSEVIDRIVQNVLNQIGTPADSSAMPAASPNQTSSARPVSRQSGSTQTNPAQPGQGSSLSSTRGDAGISLSEQVITAEVLSKLSPGTQVQVSPRALITPAARDVIASQKLQVVRAPQQTGSPRPGSAQTGQASQAAGGSRLLIVVRNTPAVDQLWQELSGSWRRELQGCPDDAAKLAMGEIARGGAAQVVILADQTHRAACLANRHERVKAVAIRDAGELRLVRKQLRANVWCLDVGARTYFELKNLFREIQSIPAP